MINGAHAIIYSNDPDADRELFKGVLGLPYVDAGGGWLIFGLPPAEVAFHPDESGKPGHELYLLCDDVDATVQRLAGEGVSVDPGFHDEPWGRLAFIRLPGGGKLGVYQPRHPRASGLTPKVRKLKAGERGIPGTTRRTSSKAKTPTQRGAG